MSDRNPPDTTENANALRRTFLKAATATGAVAFTGQAAAGDRSLLAQDDANESADGGNESAEGDDGAMSPIGEGPAVRAESVADGLTAPTSMAVADEETDRRFVVDQVGQIYVHGEDGLEDEPFLDVTDRIIELDEGFDERGLLGLAFHPEFQDNGRFYVRYSAPPTDDVPEGYDHTFVLAEFQTEGEDNASADPESERRLLELPEPQFNHNAGPIAFGPDGYLYVATGDGGGANDAGEGHVEDWYDENEGGNAQNTSENLLGGILRIDVDSEDGDQPYGIPDDNPLVGEDGQLEEYYAWGLRNPWGMSFHDEALFVADVGQNLYEEVNIVEAGGNYGWNVKEGTHCFSPESPDDPPEDCPDETPEDVRGGEPLIDPVIEYPQEDEEGVVGTAVVGGTVYDGDALSDLQGGYVFGDYSTAADDPDGSVFVARPPEEGTYEAGDDGELWDIEELSVEVAGGDDGAAGADGGEAGGADETVEGNESEENETTEDGMADNETANVTDGNETVEDGNVTEGNETSAGESGANETAADGGASANGGEEGRLGRFLLGIGRDGGGQMYLLTSQQPGPSGDTGEVLRLASPDGNGDGEEASQEDDGDGEAAASYELEGYVAGWEGVSPGDIEGENNPTLQFPVGETVEVVWTNGDGQAHNFAVETEDGENLVETDLMSGTGETQTVEFEVTEDMAEYYCVPHSGSMRGDIELAEE